MAKDELIEARLTESIIGAFYEVYNHLGFGFLESIYVRALVIELEDRGHRVEREVVVDIYYKGRFVGRHRLDLVVDGKAILELKSRELFPAFGPKQCLSYLKATRMEVGLVLHFGPSPKFKRVVCQARPLGSAAAIRRTPGVPRRASPAGPVQERDQI